MKKCNRSEWKPVVAAIFLALGSHACSTPPADLSEVAQAEILQAEADFAAMAQKEGVPSAFETFAAEDGVIHRNNLIIEGKQAIADFYHNGNWKNTTLNWVPDKVVASKSGDLGYTYGRFLYSTQDSTGQTNTVEGIFHTVWKKQPDGHWRFVWD